MSDEELQNQVIMEFERYFGTASISKSYIDVLGGERMVVVENNIKRAFYDMSGNLIKVINLKGEIE